MTNALEEKVARAICLSKQRAGDTNAVAAQYVETFWRDYLPEAHIAVATLATPSAPVSAPSPAGGVREALEAFDNLLRYGARANCEQALRAADGTMFRFDDRSAFFLSDIDRDAIRAALTPEPVSAPANGEVVEAGLRAEIAHDNFSGDIIGKYVTREGKRGVVVQQDGTRVVHVYGEKWLPVATQIALSNPAPGHGEGVPVAEPRAWIANDPEGGPYLTWSAEAAANYPNPEPLYARPATGEKEGRS